MKKHKFRICIKLNKPKYNNNKIINDKNIIFVKRNYSVNSFYP